MTTGLVDTPRDVERVRTPISRAGLADNVEIVLETYIGGATMTIGELNALKSDDVVTLDCALNAQVDLRVNGVCIGQGELVAVGDRFGVRLTTLAP